MLCPLSVFNVSPQSHDLYCRRRKYNGLYIVETGYASIIDKKNVYIKLVVLTGEHSISRGSKFPGYSREGRRGLVCTNIGEGLNA